MFKDREHFIEELNKSIKRDLEEALIKSIKPDKYDSSKHNYPPNRPEMTEEQEQQHHKLFINANPHGGGSGSTQTGEEESDNYTTSAHHYLKTGRALKFPNPENTDTSTSARKHFKMPSLASGKKGKIPG